MERDWVNLKQETIDLGENNFIEINLKQPPGSETRLIAISKGWYNQESQKRYKSNILFSPEKKDELIKILQNIEN